MSLVTISNLCVLRQERPICQVDSLRVERGARLAVLGPNGSGKTTLLRIVAGLEPDYSGSLVVDLPTGEISYVHQQPWMFRGSVMANVRYAQRVKHQQLHAILQALDIEHLSNQNARSLSGGEMRRVALARALAYSPRLLLLDEPLADLDQGASQRVLDLLDSQRELTLLIASPVDLPRSLSSEVFHLSPRGELSP